MNARNLSKLLMGAAVLAAWMLVPSAFAQRGRGPQGPQVVSPEVSADRRITFRISTMRDPMAQFRRVVEDVLPYVND